jgi:hypothetical protein
MISLRNQIILGGTLLSVFLFTWVWSSGVDVNKYLGFIGMSIGTSTNPTSSIALALKAETKIGDIGDKVMVTRKALVTPVMSPITRSLSPMSPSPIQTVILTPNPTTSPYIFTTSPTPFYNPSPSFIPTTVYATPGPTSPVVPTATPDQTPEPSLQPIVINEIAWMGTINSASDEWIEFYNDNSQDISLEGWHLKAADGSPDIVLHGIIPTQGYYLIERTDDTTISDIKANLVTTFGHGLSNDGENLMLVNNTGNIIDTVDAQSGWFAGDNTEKVSMERISPFRPGSEKTNWANNQSNSRSGHDSAGNPINGSPNSKNSVFNTSL